MKIIKKITAIMLSIMMVLGMCSVVGAAETGTGETGKITINKAIDGQKYKIYKMLELESFDKGKGLYSYKPVAEWEEFFNTGEGKAYVDINENGYVTWKTSVTEEKAAELAQEALAYAKKTTTINNAGEATANGTTVTFDNLELGYYLVDSSLGALCGLTTTNRTATIEEKNGVPSVEKKIDENGTKNDSNFANIGDTITFETTIHVKKGASNYVLHDKMSDGWKLTTITPSYHPYDIYITTGKGDELSNNREHDYENDYTFRKISDNEFEVTFSETYLKKYENEEYNLIVRYNAILTGDAVINDENTNETYLTYGDFNKETQHAETTTLTHQIPVLKYTGNVNNPLAGAKFKLYSTKDGTTPIELVQKTGEQNYRRALMSEAGIITEITTDETGKFNIQGFKPGTYWLEESAAPKGYNKLAKRIEVKIGEYGNLTIDGKDRENNLPITQVNVENKSGSLLPSTGGIGTTIFYIAGAFLVLISGVVLIAKKRTDSK